MTLETLALAVCFAGGALALAKRLLDRHRARRHRLDAWDRLQDARRRRDTRDQHAAVAHLRAATTAQLRAELGR